MALPVGFSGFMVQADEASQIALQSFIERIGSVWAFSFGGDHCPGGSKSRMLHIHNDSKEALRS